MNGTLSGVAAIVVLAATVGIAWHSSDERFEIPIDEPPGAAGGSGQPAPDLVAELAVCTGQGQVPTPWDPARAAEALLRVTVENRGDAVPATLCLFDAEGVQRHQEPVLLPPEGALHRVFAAPADAVLVKLEVRHTWPADDGASTWVLGRIVTGGNLDHCPERTADFGFDYAFYQASGSSTAKGPTRSCAAGMNLQTAGLTGSDPAAPVTFPTDDVRGTMWVFVSAVGAAALVAAGWPWLRVAALPLFTRLRGPRSLDHPVRRRLMDLVEADPGVHANELARRAELRPGQAQHHLGVLCRWRLVASVRVAGRRHCFPFGTVSPREMRAIAMARWPTRAEVLAAIRHDPGATVTQVARRTGLSKGTVSKAVRRLSEAGLVVLGDGRTGLTAYGA